MAAKASPVKVSTPRKSTAKANSSAKPNKTMSVDTSIVNRDNYENIFTGFGKRQDHTYAMAPTSGIMLPDISLSNIYAGDGLGSRILSLLPHDMVKNGYRVTGDTQHIIHKELKRVNNKEHMKTALTWARTYGGAITVLGVEDGRKFDQPMGKTIKKIQWMRTVSRTRIQVMEEDLITDPRDPNFGEYKFYHIQFGRTGGDYHKVHNSRCLIYKGLTAPDDPSWNSTTDLQYWGMSSIQPVWNQLKQLGGSFQGIAHLMMELCIGKYKLKDLAQMLSSKNAPLVLRRLELINQSKSMINGVLLDAENEDYVRDMVNVSGSDKVLEQLMIMVSAVSGYPVTVLFGRSPDGMNATGESDLSNYDSMVESSQETKLENPQQKLVKIVNSYLKVPTVDEDPTIVFNPVRNPTLSELVGIRKTQSETDNNYVMMGTHTPEQITELRFGGGYDLFNMDIDEYLTNPKPTVKAPIDTSKIDRNK